MPSTLLQHLLLAGVALTLVACTKEAPKAPPASTDKAAPVVTTKPTEAKPTEAKPPEAKPAPTIDVTTKVAEAAGSDAPLW